jgi:hypothetical protein
MRELCGRRWLSSLDTSLSSPQVERDDMIARKVLSWLETAVVKMHKQFWNVTGIGC